MTLTHPAPTLEDRRDALLAQDTHLNTTRKALAAESWRLYLAWKLLYPVASMREYIGWLGHGEVQTRWYAYLRAGLALSRGLDTPALRLGELAAMGERLLAGETVQDVQSGPGPKPDTTTIRVSRDTAAALDATFAELSDSDTRLTRQDALETAVQSFAAAPAVIRRALVHAQQTGEHPLDALVQAVEERRDYRAWLKRQPCAVPGCGVRSGIELHHLRAMPDSRFRSAEVLLPVCARHHRAEPGHSEAAHAAHQSDWILAHWPDEAAFWQALALTYIRYAQESEETA